MPSELNALRDIRDNILLARAFIGDMTEEQFRRDRKTVYATTRAIEIISEASRHLTQDIRERYPQLPWRAIRDVGNFYRHDYDNVAESAVWITTQERIGPLYDAIVAEIARLEGRNDDVL